MEQNTKQFQQTPYEKEYKQNKESFKAEIKVTELEQKQLKNDRKTVNHVGIRNYSPEVAASRSVMKKRDLRTLYYAYSQFRKQYGGYQKDIAVVGILNEQLLNILTEKYAVKTVRLDTSGHANS